MINTVRLRNSLGLLGMLLPVIVCVLSLVNGFGFPDSISATYYLDPCITPFMIILGSAGLLLISYRGYDR
jgi:formate hydrogenlyase subunit 3/multisubunit Na+/H+ antiporter MnhD subunit